MSGHSRFRLQPVDAIRALVEVISPLEDEAIFAVCVDGEGFVGLSECFRWPRSGSCPPSIETLFELPVGTHADAVMFASRTHRPIEQLHESDIDFTRRLIDHGLKVGVPVLEHILIRDHMFRVMSESMGSWPTERA